MVETGEKRIGGLAQECKLVLMEILINKFLSFSVLRHAATEKFSGEHLRQ